MDRSKKFLCSAISVVVSFFSWVAIVGVFGIIGMVMFPDAEVFPTWFSLVLVVAPIVLAVFCGKAFYRAYATKLQPPVSEAPAVQEVAPDPAVEAAEPVVEAVKESPATVAEEAAEAPTEQEVAPALAETTTVAEKVDETPSQLSDVDRIIAALMELKASIDGENHGGNHEQPQEQASAPNAVLTPEQGVQYELLTIDLMEGHDFEKWCAEALTTLGFRNVSVTRGSGDQGVDVLAEKGGVKYAIQCKRYSSDLGNTPIQEVHSGKDFYHRHVGVVLTNQHFTEGAKQLASRTGTLLWDRNWIIGYLNVKYGVTHSEAPSVPSAQPNDDDCYSAAVELVLETGQASVSMLQRRLKLGYALAARLVDRMEAEGLVGPFHGSAPREILVTKEQWQKRIANK